jgi:hypothetical protein
MLYNCRGVQMLKNIWDQKTTIVKFHKEYIMKIPTQKP